MMVVGFRTAPSGESLGVKGLVLWALRTAPLVGLEGRRA